MNGVGLIANNNNGPGFRSHSKKSHTRSAPCSPYFGNKMDAENYLSVINKNRTGSNESHLALDSVNGIRMAEFARFDRKILNGISPAYCNSFQMEAVKSKMTPENDGRNTCYTIDECNRIDVSLSILI